MGREGGGRQNLGKKFCMFQVGPGRRGPNWQLRGKSVKENHDEPFSSYINDFYPRGRKPKRGGKRKKRRTPPVNAMTRGKGA